MKQIILVLLFSLCLNPGRAQEQELAQLALNIEKLNQFRKILRNMKSGFEVLQGGYNSIKNISEGNFTLHKTFLDKLLDVNPAIKNYKKVGQIISYQKALLSEYRAAHNRFRQQNIFNATELNYISSVYDRLITGSLSTLDDLVMVVTAGSVRMSDGERLEAIDRIHGDMQQKLIFLRRFNNNTSVLAVQKAREKKDIDILRQVYK